MGPHGPRPGQRDDRTPSYLRFDQLRGDRSLGV